VYYSPNTDGAELKDEMGWGGQEVHTTLYLEHW